jgi:hypothetical protein
MGLYERLYDESENSKVRFVGFVSENARYDFGIIFTNQFFGKPLVVCMQTGRSTLMCSDEAQIIERIQQAFNIASAEEAEELSVFLCHNLPPLPTGSQY